MENWLHMSALHHLFLPLLKYTVHHFRCAWNHHPICTEHNRSPAQVVLLDTRNAPPLPHMMDAYVFGSAHDGEGDDSTENESEDDGDDGDLEPPGGEEDDSEHGQDSLPHVIVETSSVPVCPPCSVHRPERSGPVSSIGSMRICFTHFYT